MKIGIIALSGKPVHAGHWTLIKNASQEVDRLKLYVSLNDRLKVGEIPISGNDMKDIWDTHLKHALPKNVDLEYCKEVTPVRKVYEFLGNKNDELSKDTYIIYSDPNDIQRNFPKNSLQKYLSYLYQNNKIALEPVDRNDTVNVSGTEMRQFIQTGEKEKFKDNLPDVLKEHIDEIWKQFQVTVATTPIKQRKRRSKNKIR